MHASTATITLAAASRPVQLLDRGEGRIAIQRSGQQRQSFAGEGWTPNAVENGIVAKRRMFPQFSLGFHWVTRGRSSPAGEQAIQEKVSGTDIGGIVKQTPAKTRRTRATASIYHSAPRRAKRCGNAVHDSAGPGRRWSGGDGWRPTFVQPPTVTPISRVQPAGWRAASEIWSSSHNRYQSKKVSLSRMLLVSGYRPNQSARSSTQTFPRSGPVTIKMPRRLQP